MSDREPTLAQYLDWAGRSGCVISRRTTPVGGSYVIIVETPAGKHFVMPNGVHPDEILPRDAVKNYDRRLGIRSPWGQ